MHPRISISALLASTLIFVISILAGPHEAFPVNSQVPPVAYALRPYSFTISSSTFTSDSGPISYSLVNQPKWLAFDNSTRTLIGTPAVKDVGAPVFLLEAQDAQGSSTSGVTLVVVKDRGPGIGQPILPFLGRAGRTSSPATLYLYPLEQFVINLTTDIFTNVSPITQYYATSADHSPLPNWIQFNPSTLTVSGLSPPLVSPVTTSQMYEISIIASNVIGFAEISATFQLVVGRHILGFANDAYISNLIPGYHFQTSSYLGQLSLDDKQVVTGEVDCLTSNLPSWMDFDTSLVRFSGNVPLSAQNVTVTITAVDRWGDIANTTLDFLVSKSPSLFSEDIPDVNVTVGHNFNYNLDRSILTYPETKVSSNVGNASSWLSFDAANLTFSGRVPQRLPPGLSTVSILASYDGRTESETFKITVLIAERTQVSHTPTFATFATFATSATTATSTHAPTSPTTTVNGHSRKHEANHQTDLILAVVLPIICLVIVLTFALLRHRRKTRKEHDQVDERSRSTEQIISQPLEAQNAHSLVPDHTVIGGATSHSRRLTPAQPPQVELLWAPNFLRTSRKRLSRRQRPPLTDSSNSSWADLIVPALNIPRTRTAEEEQSGPSTIAMPSQLVPVPPTLSASQPRRTPLRISQPRLSRATSKGGTLPVSTFSHEATALPKRSSGAGHGAGIFGTDVVNLRAPWMTTLGSIPFVESTVGPNEGDYVRSAQRLVTASPSANAMLPKTTARLIESQSCDPLEEANVPTEAMMRREGLRRVLSTASSGQFSLPLSSESQWEDEDLIEEHTASGQRTWSTEFKAAPPRLPFETATSNENARASTASGRLRFASSRRSVSLGRGSWQRSENSHQGSLRFI